jgi:hypothetical protein
MRILFFPTINPGPQGDLLEMTILRGLREELGDDCVDYPKKKIMYHDFSESPKNSLHGRGFSLLYTPIPDIDQSLRDNVFQSKFDAVIYGDGHIYGEKVRIPKIDALANGNSWVLDGHDLYGYLPNNIIFDGEEVVGNQFSKSFKRELLSGIDLEKKIFPTGFGIPIERVLPVNIEGKKQLFQSTAPDYSLFKTVNDVGGGFTHHKFEDEKEYYRDLSESWFGLTCKKGGWDTLRHYEIIAAGSVLLFRDLHKKPESCSPQDIPAPSYSSQKDLSLLTEKLLPNGIPSEEYFRILVDQRNWLYKKGTTQARAREIIKIINHEKNSHN